MPTGKWTEPGVPHRGWTCVDVVDLGKPDETCQMCEAHEIRFVHLMEHPEYPIGLRCGCICAGNMEQDLASARARERLALRRSHWLKRRWYREINRWNHFTGAEYLNTDGYQIRVFQRHNQIWSFSVSNRTSGFQLNARKPYLSLKDAKLRTLDALLWLKERNL